MWYALLLFLAAADGPIKAQINEPVSLPVGKSCVIAAENLQLTFLRVVEDSRCPKGAQCIWAGQAIIALSIKKDAGPASEVRIRRRNQPPNLG